MHDIVDIERRGVPGVFVASSEFVEAAIAQSGALGFPGVKRVFTPHPIQDRTDEEMRAYAEAAFLASYDGRLAAWADQQPPQWQPLIRNARAPAADVGRRVSRHVSGRAWPSPGERTHGHRRQPQGQ